MVKTLQASFLVLYRVVNATGVLNTSWGRSAFETFYFFYKNHYEAKSIALPQNWIKPNTIVIDVGANIGFFTLQFSQWITGKGKVIAIEPEATNYARLQRKLTRASLIDSVEIINAAVADITGEALLELNPLHPGDHKLGKQGIPIMVTTIDALLSERDYPEVSFIKIDVQGAEQLVLNGATETIAQFQPTLFVEISDSGLRSYGSSTNALLRWCVELGYTIHLLNNNILSSPLTIEQILSFEKQRGYVDTLLIPNSTRHN
ncbi:MAG: FkbM family methyltransferase [Thioploca sp.]|nr:FkbM family methyltransferase [Thioploca sp.]